MRGIIKKHHLGDFDIEGEYVVDPGKVVVDASRRIDKEASPEEMVALIIREARDQAEALVAAAQSEADEIRASAQREGYEAGFAQLDEERAALAERLAQVDEDVERLMQEFWFAAEPEILKLAVDIANKIVHREISESEEFVLDTVKAALYQIRDRHDLKIRVNPADYDLMRDRKEDIASACDGVRSIEIIQDRRVDQGGSIIETGNGHLDARVETQLHEVERALMEALHDGRDDIAA